MRATAAVAPTGAEHATPKVLAEHWHTTPAALAQWRYLGRGPAWIRRGRRILYPWAEIRAFEQRNMQTPADSGAA